ncbi:uncharacterized protein ELE39_000852 [Cryptosporidium sp. chipmunk genotype I]|uniref:uncharacterized protein n=1 Tax=Cryptosporidium sp. chipmunk genotype I TaxID=1280935 RepID=UPI00351A9630|nr:hypothetical protein ELE39_000852 [Cryptosporidium sp. chipmunk genotype I]
MPLTEHIALSGCDVRYTVIRGQGNHCENRGRYKISKSKDQNQNIIKVLDQR